MGDIDLDLLYTPDEVAAIFKCSKQHVYRLIWQGALETVNIAPPDSTRRKQRITGEAVRDYLTTKR